MGEVPETTGWIIGVCLCHRTCSPISWCLPAFVPTVCTLHRGLQHITAFQEEHKSPFDNERQAFKQAVWSRTQAALFTLAYEQPCKSMTTTLSTMPFLNLPLMVCLNEAHPAQTTNASNSITSVSLDHRMRPMRLHSPNLSAWMSGNSLGWCTCIVSSLWQLSVPWPKTHTYKGGQTLVCIQLSHDRGHCGRCSSVNSLTCLQNFSAKFWPASTCFH